MNTINGLAAATRKTQTCVFANLHLMNKCTCTQYALCFDSKSPKAKVLISLSFFNLI